MEKRGLLGAVAMAAVENLSMLDSVDTSSSAISLDPAAAAEAPSNKKGGGIRRRRRAAGARAPEAKGVPKAAVAVSEMLKVASESSDTDEIFKSLAGMLAEAQEESQQVCVDCFYWLVLVVLLELLRLLKLL